jgi:hypothetical protein
MTEPGRGEPRDPRDRENAQDQAPGQHRAEDEGIGYGDDLNDRGRPDAAPEREAFDPTSRGDEPGEVM